MCGGDGGGAEGGTARLSPLNPPPNLPAQACYGYLRLRAPDLQAAVLLPTSPPTLFLVIYECTTLLHVFYLFGVPRQPGGTDRAEIVSPVDWGEIEPGSGGKGPAPVS